MRQAIALILIFILVTTAKAADGVLPIGEDGKPLNTDFESGDLRDWTQTSGNAFTGQPIKGDTVTARRSDMKSGHAGEWWIGTFELNKDGPRGIIQSKPFKVTHPWATFLVGGGSNDESVDIVLVEGNKLFFHATGDNKENMEAVKVDLRPIMGKMIYLRIVDDHSFSWGHINFDDFRFYENEPNVPERAMLTEDVVAHAGLAPEEAVKAITLPPGFKATLFAGEPDVHQPIAFTIDDRGRLWVAEAHTYPIRAKEGEGKDNILIFEDVDGDGKFDTRTVFMTGLNLVSGIEVGFGGVWVGAAPYLMFIPDKDGDDKPDSDPQILLDGWAYQDTHETLNAFTWGPDGWLYGCHGVFTHSLVGRPGTKKADRIPLNAAVWRYHPQKHLFEIFAEGTSNPWGIDFNDHGQAFITACVIPHLYHVIQGAHYQRQAGQHFNPHVYRDIQNIGDHVHWLGESGPHAGNLKSGAAGGGHAHCGAMIYLGGSFPKEYRDTLFMANIHGNRLNNDRLMQKGSGYVGAHAPDPVLMNDKWSRPIAFKYGPDGSVYVIDWYDKQACHNPLNEIWDRTNGRIYRISYGDTKPFEGDLQRLSNEELVKLQLHENEWYVRHARRILQERGAAKEVVAPLAEMLKSETEAPKKLRALWALYCAGGVTKELLLQQLEADNPYIRAWAIALTEKETFLASESTFAELARNDSSAVVRLYLASALQRMPPQDRWPILENLVAHGEDADDHNLPLMYWYAAEPAIGADPSRGIMLAKKSKIPLLRELIARRLCAVATADAEGDGAKVKVEPLNALATLLSEIDDPAFQKDVLLGMSDGLRGWPKLPTPAEWSAVYDKLSASDDTALRNRMQELSVVFGEERALSALRTMVTDSAAALGARTKAIEALVGAGDAKVVTLLHGLIDDAALRGPALRGLAAFEAAETPGLILKSYDAFDTTTKVDALNTLASRANYAKVLMEAVNSGHLPKTDITAATLRQLGAVEDPAVQGWLLEHFGKVKQTPQEKLDEIERWKKIITRPKFLSAADPSRGRAIFAKTCMQCHTLFDAGGKVGPDLTGSNRADATYALSNIVDPSAVIGKDYLVSILKTADKRVLSGIIKSDDGNVVTLQTESEVIPLPKSQITFQKEQDISMMPEGLLAGLKNEEVRDLIAYLASPRQVPILATKQNEAEFFNGKDLAGWQASPDEQDLWSVENGEIVGRATEPLKRNQFLFGNMSAENFRLTFKVKLAHNKGNSGVQFRSEPIEHGEARGYQADIGPGWWGKLYEENGRAVLWNEPGEKYVKPDDWNDYEILAIGSRIRTFINGQPCVDLDDPDGAKRGLFALQLHSGPPMEVRFKEIKLEVDPVIEP